MKTAAPTRQQHNGMLKIYMIWLDCQEEIEDSCTGNGIFYFCKVFPSTEAYTYQETIEEFVHTEAQHADQDVCYVIEKSHVHDDCSVATGESSTVPNKAHQKHYFITKLWEARKARFIPSEKSCYLLFALL